MPETILLGTDLWLVGRQCGIADLVARQPGIADLVAHPHPA